MARVDITLTRPSPEGDGPTPRSPRELKLQRLFPVWIAMGSGRNLAAVGQKEGIPVREMIAHAKKFDWQGRASRLSRTADEKLVDGEMVEAIANVNAEQINELRELRKKAMDYLRTCAFDKPADAIKLALETMKLEREIRGLDQKGKEGEIGEVLKQLVQGLDLIPADTKEFEFNPDFKVEELPDEPPALPAPTDEGESREDEG